MVYVVLLQTVNQLEAEVEVTKQEAESDSAPVVPEPQHTPESQADFDLQTHPQDQETQVTPTTESVPAQRQVSAETPAPSETSSDTPAGYPSLNSNSAPPPDEAENIPTSQSAIPSHTGYVHFHVIIPETWFFGIRSWL